LSASAPSSHDLSLAAFIINIAESDFRHTQAFYSSYRLADHARLKDQPLF
jgi:hypothetical protein